MCRSIFETNNSVKHEMLDLGMSPLHLRIRIMDFLFNLGIRISCGGHKVSMTSPAFTEKKKQVQERFKSELKIMLFQVKIGKGNANCGNSTLIFFQNYEKRSEILGLPVELIKGFHELLMMVNSTRKKPNEVKFKEICDKVFDILIMHPQIKNITMSPSAHRLLVHRELYIRHHVNSPGVISEMAGESRNKFNKPFREYNAFKGSLARNILDFGKFMLSSTDPPVAIERMQKRKYNCE